MEKVRGYFQALYQREDTHTPGLPLGKNAEPAKVYDKIPSEEEVEAVVRRLRPHREGRHTHLRVEYLKKWRKEVYPNDQSNTPPWIERWLCLVENLQHMCRTGEIPQEF